MVGGRGGVEGGDAAMPKACWSPCCAIQDPGSHNWPVGPSTYRTSARDRPAGQAQALLSSTDAAAAHTHRPSLPCPSNCRQGAKKDALKVAGALFASLFYKEFQGCLLPAFLRRTHWQWL